jgi:hypothetical protein
MDKTPYLQLTLLKQIRKKKKIFFVLVYMYIYMSNDTRMHSYTLIKSSYIGIAIISRF